MASGRCSLSQASAEPATAGSTKLVPARGTRIERMRESSGGAAGAACARAEFNAKVEGVDATPRRIGGVKG